MVAWIRFEETDSPLVQGAQGFELLDWRGARFFEGPDAWLRSRNQLTYRIEVRDREGFTREGYLIIGSYWIGWPFSRKVRVVWD